MNDPGELRKRARERMDENGWRIQSAEDQIWIVDEHGGLLSRHNSVEGACEWVLICAAADEIRRFAEACRHHPRCYPVHRVFSWLYDPRRADIVEAIRRYAGEDVESIRAKRIADEMLDGE